MKSTSFLRFIQIYPWHLQIIGLLPCFAMLLFLRLSIGQGADLYIFFAGCRNTAPLMAFAMKMVTHLTGPFFYAIFAWMFIRAIRRKNHAEIKFVITYGLVHACLAIAVAQFAKLAIGKPRPWEALQGSGYVPFSSEDGQHAFPSGHTTDAASSAYTLMQYKRSLLYSLILGCIIALLGFSRIYLGRHNPVDIVGGLLFGSFTAFMVHYLYTWQWKKPTS